jgi:ribulose-5-phosphate 4-epimerase/fuculose-1-phosphate aldolase
MSSGTRTPASAPARLDEAQAREEICRVGASLFARGYVHATAGNISVRMDDGFFITPTDACLGFLDPARLARVDEQGRQTDGDRASKTLTLHRAIYQATEAAGEPCACVIHTHSTHCVALSLQTGGDELLDALTPYFVMKVGHVPLAPYHRPGDPAVATWVARAIADWAARGAPLRAVMLSRLGPNVWHDTPAAAMATLEELEETARLQLLSARTGTGPAPLSPAAIDELRQTFGARW